MSKESSTSRCSARNTSWKNSQVEANENEFETPHCSIYFPPPRMPLNSIPDPFQCQKESHEAEAESQSNVGAKVQSTRFLDKKIEIFDRNASGGNQKFLSRGGERLHSEPNSAQSTPARNLSRVSLGGGGRVTLHNGGGGSARLLKGISFGDVGLPCEILHFNLEEEPSYWRDHNVQVLIRIRPLSTMEKTSQGYGICLRQESAQTLVWLGHPETRFTFDHVACETISQENLFRVAGVPMVENCMSGYNSCMFAYGQTGSGKTYTMMGEIHEIEDRLDKESGITPRIFEYLFARISAEENMRKGEKLKYSCKCSFLEIYNEQVTDLLEPSSTNLQLREDLKRGVYVENLTEHSVKSVHDVLQLLQQGSANRKIAATNMNGESSRSHSVFTCIIESHWEKDSMTHFRFARLNLVDLAGSERQKSSGAEGDRLKEAANINKSLSTLGLVIMSLVDLAHGKQRHVPYRDSRLTFLLQDSLGGNSKTMIIANVSPSICSANETLSTLKFAQRAKLIQNNAKVNEDASGNITALQRQIEQLKGQLSFLMNQKSFSRALPCFVQSPGNCKSSSLSKEYIEGTTKDCHKILLLSREIKCLKAALVGALRREKIAETVSEGLKNEIERLNSLVSQREEEVEHSVMKLKLNKEKIKQLEYVAAGTLSAEKFLFEENKALQEEIQFLETRYDKNPEITRLGLENHRLSEQIRLIQNFGEQGEQGERERLLTELSELHNQILGAIEGDLIFPKSNEKKQDRNVANELEYCRNMKHKLIREVDQLQTKVRMYLSPPFFDSELSSSSEHIDKAHEMDRCSMVETMSIRSNSVDEIPCHAWEHIENLLDLVDNSQIQGPPTLFGALKNEETCPTSETSLIMQVDLRLEETCSPKVKEDTESISQSSRFFLISEEAEKSNESPLLHGNEDIGWDFLQTKSGMNEINILEEVKFPDSQCQEKLKLPYQNPLNLVHGEIEMDTTKIVKLLQGNVISLQSEVHEKLFCMAQENAKLKSALVLKEKEMKALEFQWERAVLELTDFLVDGSKSLRDATGQVESISHSFPLVNTQISEHIERAVKVFVGKEETIQLLQSSLEDAQTMVQDLELNFASLRGATMALNESQQVDINETKENVMKEKISSTEKTNIVNIVCNELKCDKVQKIEIEHNAVPVSVVAAQRFSDRFLEDNDVIAVSDQICSKTYSEGKAHHLTCKYLVDHAEMSELGIVEMEKAFDVFCPDAILQEEVLKSKMSSASEYKNIIWKMSKGIQDFRKNSKELEIKGRLSSQPCLIETSSRGLRDSLNFKKMLHILHKFNQEFTETSEKLSLIAKFIKREGDSSLCPWIDEVSTETDIRSVDCSSSDSDSLEGSVGSRSKDDASSSKCSPITSERLFEQTKEFLESGGPFLPQCDEKRLNISEYLPNDATICWLRSEFHSSFISFNKLYRQLSAFLTELDDGYYHFKETKGVPPRLELQTEAVEADRHNGSEVSGQETYRADKFFSKFEEAHETIREADLMLNALVKANCNAKHMSEMWKVAGEDLTAQRTSLTKEIEQLNSLISAREKENEMLKDHAHGSLIEIANSISYVEKQFFQMQRDVENKLQTLHSDVFLVGHETLLCVNNLRSSLEGISSQLMETRMMSSVLYHCYKDKVIHELFSAKHDDYSLLLEESKCIFPANEGSSEEENENEVYGVSCDRPIYETLTLKKELGRKEELLEGLLFDLRLLQESASKKKDIENENEKLRITVRKAQQELDKKLNELNDMIAEYRKLQGYVADVEIDLSKSNSELGHAKEIIRHLSCQNEDLRGIVKDLNAKISEAGQQLEEQKEVIKCFDKELFRFSCTSEEQHISSLDALEEELRKVIGERDKLHKGVSILKDKLVMACALADENEAIAAEARQESEASKMYAEQKEEEVKILENSVEELECTINVLEKKVHEMDEEVGRDRLIKDSLEVELQSLRQRLLAVENLPQIADSESIYLQQAEEKMSRQLQDKLLEAQKRIGLLEEEKEEQEKEIKQYRDYISEVLLHAEAQSLQYQQKYKSLESMARDLKPKLSSSTSTPLTVDKCEKISTRTRGSSSPFRCIANLVHQMNLEKDHELSMSRAQIQELEAMVASKQKEVCMLNSRLAAVESMTHDVIRDLLGVKLDITGYANLIEQTQILKLVEDAKHHKEELFAKREEILNLRRQIDDLIEERERCLLELKNRQADVLSTQINLTQLQERDQLLSAENEGLKISKRNLMRKVAQLDEMVKTLTGTQNTQVQPLQQMSKIMRGSLKHGEPDLERRLSQSEKILSRVNNELARYHHPGSTSLREKTSQAGVNNKTSSTPFQ